MDMIVTSIIENIPGFKIRSKDDAFLFVRRMMGNGSTCILNIEKNHQIIISKKDYSIYVDERHGDLSNPFNPSFEIATTDPDRKRLYTENVYDVVWKYRKYINKEFLS